MAISVRKRFEVFKRDGFRCRYCGKGTPAVVLEVDHVVPVAGGGGDDEMNLVTACWECNSGKSDRPLTESITGEDPHDRAVMMLERERQLREYNVVLGAMRTRIDAEVAGLNEFWQAHCGRQFLSTDDAWLRTVLEWCPVERVKMALQLAIDRRKVSDLSYVNAILRNWRQEGKL